MGMTVTLKIIRENLEDARKGLQYRVPDDGFNLLVDHTGKTLNGTYQTRLPGLHEAKLYSICEGLIVEIERLQKRVSELEGDKPRELHQIDGFDITGRGPVVICQESYYDFDPPPALEDRVVIDGRPATIRGIEAFMTNPPNYGDHLSILVRWED